MDGPLGLSSSFALAGKKLDIHKRLVALAAAREALCQQVQLLEEQKVQLSEQKLAEQHRLLHALKMRLDMAQGSLDGQMGDLHSKCRAVESQMEAYGRLLRGTEAEPSPGQWQQMEAQFQRLQGEQALVLDPEDFRTQLHLLRVSGAPDVEPIKRELAELKRQHEATVEHLTAARAEARAAHEHVAELLPQLREAQEASSAGGRVDIGREVRAVREQYEHALELMQKEHQRESAQLRAEAAQLREELEELQVCAPLLAGAVTPGDSPCREDRQSMGGVRLLREALGAGGARTEQRKTPRHSCVQRLLLDIQARSIEERQKMDAQHQQEMQKQAVAHEAAMRGLVASHEAAMGRLTALLESQPSRSVAQMQREAAMEVEALRRDLEAAHDAMESMKEDHDSQLGYELYKARVAHQKELIAARGSVEQAASEELEAMRRRAEQLEAELEAAQGPDGSPSREELMAALAELHSRHDSEVRQAAENVAAERMARADAELLHIQERHQAEVATLKEEHRAALAQRDAELAAMLSELMSLREQHFASSSSGIQRPPGQSSPATASESVPGPAAPGELSLAHMGSDSLLTLSPSSMSTAPREAAGSPQRLSVAAAAAQPSPAESAASTGGTSALAARPTALAMSSLVAAVLGGGRDRLREASQSHPDPGSTEGRSSAVSNRKRPPLRCLRCGETEQSSPGVCRFHPFLVKAPNPFLYGPEWHLCKAAGHSSDDSGCHTRLEHYYPTGIAESLAAAACCRPEGPHVGGDADPPPQPRAGRNLPTPTALAVPT